MINITEALQFILLKCYLKRKKYCSEECKRARAICDFCKYFDFPKERGEGEPEKGMV